MLATTLPARAQTTDTTVFSAADFYEIVTQYHPIVRLAVSLSAEAQQELLQARGAFDPKLYTNYDRKNFGDILYYNSWQSGVAVPIMPGGLDFKVEHDRIDGRFVNPASRIPDPLAGLTTVGISAPVGQGLLIDARRNALRQAQLGLNLAEAERLSLINKTLFDAAKTYWDWYLAYQQYRLINEGFQLADTRFRAIRQRALLGDAAIIDTTEALITVQDRQVQLQQANVELQNARLRLTAFLWRTDGPGGAPRPVELPANVVPQPAYTGTVDEALLQTMLARAAEQHPDLQKLIVKGQQLAIEERFRRALLMPQINVSAGLLTGSPMLGLGNGLVGDTRAKYGGFQAENHKITLDVVFPLFLRKERGKLRQVQIKAQQVQLDRQQTGRDIANDVQAAWNDLRALEQQIIVQQQAVTNQRRLLRAEQQRFDLGESSIFLVNTRETKFIDLGVKLEELRAKYQKAVAGLWYAAGSNATVSQ